MNINTDHIGTEVGRCGGKPRIRGHRFTVAQILAELAQGCTVGELAAGYEIGQISSSALSTIWGRCSKNRNG